MIRYHAYAVMPGVFHIPAVHIEALLAVDAGWRATGRGQELTATAFLSVST